MGVKSFRVVLDRDEPVYYPGAAVAGRVCVRLSKAADIDAVVVRAVGQLTTKGRRGIASSKAEVDVVALVEAVVAQEAGGAGSLRLEAGNHEWPFALQLPTHTPAQTELPGSYEGRSASIRYTLVTTLVGYKRMFGGAPCLVQPIAVVPSLDIGKWSFPEEEAKVHETEAGNLRVSAHMPRSAYACGETVRVSVAIKNDTDRAVKRVRLTCVQLTTCTRGGRERVFAVPVPMYASQESSKPVMRVDLADEPIQAGDTASLGAEVSLPPLPATFSLPRLGVSYYFEVATAAGRLGKFTTRLNFVLGTLSFSDAAARGPAPGDFHPPSVHAPFPTRRGVGGSITRHAQGETQSGLVDVVLRPARAGHSARWTRTAKRAVYPVYKPSAVVTP